MSDIDRDQYLVAEEPYRGRLIFDRRRHQLQMNLPIDYPRINQFPEWFTVDPELEYEVSLQRPESRKKDIRVYSGEEDRGAGRCSAICTHESKPDIGPKQL